MMTDFERLLSSLPPSAPQEYRDLLNRRFGTSFTVKPQNTISLTLMGIAMVFAALIFSIYLTFDRGRLEQNINAAAWEYIIFSFSTFLMILFVVAALLRFLWELATTYEFDADKITVRSWLAPNRTIEIHHREVKHVLPRGFFVRVLSFANNSNVNIVTNADRLHILRSISQAHFLIAILIKLAAESQNKSPRLIALTPDIDEYLTASGKIPRS